MELRHFLGLVLLFGPIIGFFVHIYYTDGWEALRFLLLMLVGTGIVAALMVYGVTLLHDLPPFSAIE